MGALLRFLRVSWTLSAFVFFWGGAFVLAWTWFPLLALVHRDELSRRRACQRIQKRGFRLFHGYMGALGLLEMKVGSSGEPSPEGPFVMVANHQTLVDVTAILATYEGVCCFVKSSHMQNPFISRLLRYCGHIDAGTGTGLGGAAAIQAGLDRLAEGFSVLVFPEGTRSPPGGLHPFRRGAFELACRAGVPLHPIFVLCTPPALSKGVPFWAQPDRTVNLELQPWKRVETQDRSARELAKTVEASYRLELDRRSATADNAPDGPVLRNLDDERLHRA